MKKGFTLAEILIVLAVIGVISAILLPAARNVTPNQDVLKFKKAHNALYSAIRELVNSDEYYLDGDLGIKADGSPVDEKYFCKTLSDVLNPKSVSCSSVDSNLSNADQQMIDDNSMGSLEYYFDLACKTAGAKVGDEIVFSDGVAFYQSGPTYPFSQVFPDRPDERVYATKVNGFLSTYKMFCIDIDGTPSNVTRDNCINECPFGYGIRIDGKILAGERATAWLEKSIQNKD